MNWNNSGFGQGDTSNYFFASPLHSVITEIAPKSYLYKAKWTQSSLFVWLSQMSCWVYSVCLSVSPNLFLSVCLCLLISVFLSVCLYCRSVCLSQSLPVSLSASVHFNLSVRLSVGLSVCLSQALSICLSVSVYSCVSGCLSKFQSWTCVSVCFSVH